ncbi:GNAT family protein [Nocardioides sp. CN2-186]|uniref:GNAT family N-acetyltransferase n=1 Tax=Nocardioides tweenelious TaxID=3156607 RepID=UPI0032B3AC51
MTQDAQQPQDLSPVAWPARTARLSLRPATSADIETMWAYRRIPSSYEWIGHDFSSHDTFVERMSTPDSVARTLVIELDGRIVGDLYLNIGDAWAQSDVADQAAGSQAELGWAVDPAYAGQGIATEAAGELVRICFEELGLRRVKALCFADNVASWKVMERLGMRREEYAVKDSLHRTKGWLDGMTYALLADEWRAARQATT